ncbi:SDR family NAD(P)-dependent oxidoreductase [Nocardia stercoris]|uniref:SDR family oxidoreductase n=1 Tax=Nocardia stercoris TaxID=2483361 RepID=A0A3M2LF43_9NOCA|nr:SDR family oxidoreductase [Nocardia stercoris]RMI35183.1 SDR family oxidoreductase [Nocardia stercoris]
MTDSSPSFTDRRVIVTGASGGVGGTLVRLFRDAGAQVIGTDVVPGEGVVACDLRDENAITDFAGQAVADLGGLDILCNVAGVQHFARLGDITAAELRLHTDVNLVAPMLLTQAVAPALVASAAAGRGGNVVTIASISATFAQPYNSVYCASKAGVLLGMRSLAIELAQQRVRVNCVSPGGIETPMPHNAARALPADIDWSLLMKSTSAFPGFMPPADVCDAVLFLASDAAKSITGTNLVVDRGVVF